MISFVWTPLCLLEQHSRSHILAAVAPHPRNLGEACDSHDDGGAQVTSRCRKWEYAVQREVMLHVMLHITSRCTADMAKKKEKRKKASVMWAFKKLSDSVLLFPLQIMIEFCPGGAVDATMLGKPLPPFLFCLFYAKIVLCWYCFYNCLDIGGCHRLFSFLAWFHFQHLVAPVMAPSVGTSGACFHSVIRSSIAVWFPCCSWENTDWARTTPTGLEWRK